jgi:hypothetical protein
MSESQMLAFHWKLAEWSNQYSDNSNPMTEDEIESAIKQLRDNCYPSPTDCPQSACPKYRPTCTIGCCRIAILMCGEC